VFSNTSSSTGSTGVDFGNSIFGATGRNTFLASSGTGELFSGTSNNYTLTSALNVNN
jgi:hypothetical protein